MGSFSRLFFLLLIVGCTAKPIDLKIPENHPANPQAPPSPPSTTPDYIFHLPSQLDLPEKKGPANQNNGGKETESPEHGKDGIHHGWHKHMNSNMRGAAHGD